ncbi:MAG: biotin/lipoyl-binding protein [Bacteroidales bacterium]|nr:biotin/lipoyl-binding protein [Bacteroidales bacterium]
MKNYKFTISGNTYEVDVINVEGNIVRLEVNGTSYLVEIHKEVKHAKTPTLVRPVLREPQKKIEKSDVGSLVIVKAPLPGIILEISVKAGDVVSKGDKLVVMEAMKMENDIKAEKDGEIRSVRVIIGQTVLQDEVILEMDLL